jgi:hypothetical protein
MSGKRKILSTLIVFGKSRMEPMLYFGMKHGNNFLLSTTIWKFFRMDVSRIFNFFFYLAPTMDLYVAS